MCVCVVFFRAMCVRFNARHAVGALIEFEVVTVIMKFQRGLSEAKNGTVFACS
jgi:hypothetical protein